MEEFLPVQEQISTTVQPVHRIPANKEMKDNMEISEELSLTDLT